MSKMDIYFLKALFDRNGKHYQTFQKHFSIAPFNFNGKLALNLSFIKSALPLVLDVQLYTTWLIQTINNR